MAFSLQLLVAVLLNLFIFCLCQESNVLGSKQDSLVSGSSSLVNPGFTNGITETPDLVSVSPSAVTTKIISNAVTEIKETLSPSRTVQLESVKTVLQSSVISNNSVPQVTTLNKINSKTPSPSTTPALSSSTIIQTVAPSVSSNQNIPTVSAVQSTVTLAIQPSPSSSNVNTATTSVIDSSPITTQGVPPGPSSTAKIDGNNPVQRTISQVESTIGEKRPLVSDFANSPFLRSSQNAPGQSLEHSVSSVYSLQHPLPSSSTILNTLSSHSDNVREKTSVSTVTKVLSSTPEISRESGPETTKIIPTTSSQLNILDKTTAVTSSKILPSKEILTSSVVPDPEGSSVNADLEAKKTSITPRSTSSVAGNDVPVSASLQKSASLVPTSKSVQAVTSSVIQDVEGTSSSPDLEVKKTSIIPSSTASVAGSDATISTSLQKSATISTSLQKSASLVPTSNSVQPVTSSVVPDVEETSANQDLVTKKTSITPSSTASVTGSDVIVTTSLQKSASLVPASKSSSVVPDVEGTSVSPDLEVKKTSITPSFTASVAGEVTVSASLVSTGKSVQPVTLSSTTNQLADSTSVFEKVKSTVLVSSSQNVPLVSSSSVLEKSVLQTSQVILNSPSPSASKSTEILASPSGSGDETTVTSSFGATSKIPDRFSSVDTVKTSSIGQVVLTTSSQLVAEESSKIATVQTSNGGTNNAETSIVQSGTQEVNILTSSQPNLAETSQSKEVPMSTSIVAETSVTPSASHALSSSAPNLVETSQPKEDIVGTSTVAMTNAAETTIVPSAEDKSLSSSQPNLAETSNLQIQGTSTAAVIETTIVQSATPELKSSSPSEAVSVETSKVKTDLIGTKSTQILVSANELTTSLYSIGDSGSSQEKTLVVTQSPIATLIDSSIVSVSQETLKVTGGESSIIIIPSSTSSKVTKTVEDSIDPASTGDVALSSMQTQPLIKDESTSVVQATLSLSVAISTNKIDDTTVRQDSVLPDISNTKISQGVGSPVLTDSLVPSIAPTVEVGNSLVPLLSSSPVYQGTSGVTLETSIVEDSVFPTMEAETSVALLLSSTKINPVPEDSGSVSVIQTVPVVEGSVPVTVSSVVATQSLGVPVDGLNSQSTQVPVDLLSTFLMGSDEQIITPTQSIIGIGEPTASPVPGVSESFGKASILSGITHIPLESSMIRPSFIESVVVSSSLDILSETPPGTKEITGNQTILTPSPVETKIIDLTLSETVLQESGISILDRSSVNEGPGGSFTPILAESINRTNSLDSSIEVTSHYLGISESLGGTQAMTKNIGANQTAVLPSGMGTQEMEPTLSENIPEPSFFPGLNVSSEDMVSKLETDSLRASSVPTSIEPTMIIEDSVLHTEPPAGYSSELVSEFNNTISQPMNTKTIEGNLTSSQLSWQSSMIFPSGNISTGTATPVDDSIYTEVASLSISGSLIASDLVTPSLDRTVNDTIEMSLSPSSEQSLPIISISQSPDVNATEFPVTMNVAKMTILQSGDFGSGNETLEMSVTETILPTGTMGVDLSSIFISPSDRLNDSNINPTQSVEFPVSGIGNESVILSPSQEVNATQTGSLLVPQSSVFNASEQVSYSQQPEISSLLPSFPVLNQSTVDFGESLNSSAPISLTASIMHSAVDLNASIAFTILPTHTFDTNNTDNIELVSTIYTLNSSSIVFQENATIPMPTISGSFEDMSTMGLSQTLDFNFTLGVTAEETISLYPDSSMGFNESGTNITTQRPDPEMTASAFMFSSAVANDNRSEEFQPDYSGMISPSVEPTIFPSVQENATISEGPMESYNMTIIPEPTTVPLETLNITSLPEPTMPLETQNFTLFPEATMPPETQNFTLFPEATMPLETQNFTLFPEPTTLPLETLNITLSPELSTVPFETLNMTLFPEPTTVPLDPINGTLFPQPTSVPLDSLNVTIDPEPTYVPMETLNITEVPESATVPMETLNMTGFPEPTVYPSETLNLTEVLQPTFYPTEVLNITESLNMTISPEPTMYPSEAFNMTEMLNMTISQEPTIYPSETLNMTEVLNMTISPESIIYPSETLNITEVPEPTVYPSGTLNMTDAVNMTLLPEPTIHPTETLNMTEMLNMTISPEPTIYPSEALNMTDAVNMTLLPEPTIHPTETLNMTEMLNMTISQEPTIFPSEAMNMTDVVNMTMSPEPTIYPTEELNMTDLVNMTISLEPTIYPSETLNITEALNMTISLEPTIYPSETLNITEALNMTISPEPTIYPSEALNMTEALIMTISPEPTSVMTSIFDMENGTILATVSPSTLVPSPSLNFSFSIESSVFVNETGIQPSIETESMSPSATIVTDFLSIAASLTLMSSPGFDFSSLVEPTMVINGSLVPSITSQVTQSMIPGTSFSMSASIDISPTTVISSSLIESLTSMLTPAITPDVSMSQSMTTVITPSINASSEITPTATTDVSPSVPVTTPSPDNVTANGTVPETTTEAIDATTGYPTLNLSNAFIPNYVKTAIRVNMGEDVNSVEFSRKLERRLAGIYNIAYKRLERLVGKVSRRKRAATDGPITLQMINVTRTPPDSTNTELVYYMHKDGNVTSAEGAVTAIDTIEDQEMAIMMGYVVNKKGEVYSPPPEPEDKKLWIIGVVFGVIIGIVLIAWCILFIYFKCTRPAKPLSPRQSSRRSRRGDPRGENFQPVENVKGFDVVRTDVGLLNESYQKSSIGEYPSSQTTNGSPPKAKSQMIVQQEQPLQHSQRMSKRAMEESFDEEESVFEGDTNRLSPPKSRPQPKPRISQQKPRSQRKPRTEGRRDYFTDPEEGEDLDSSRNGMFDHVSRKPPTQDHTPPPKTKRSRPNKLPPISQSNSAEGLPAYSTVDREVEESLQQKAEVERWRNKQRQREKKNSGRKPKRHAVEDEANSYRRIHDEMGPYVDEPDVRYDHVPDVFVTQPYKDKRKSGHTNGGFTPIDSQGRQNGHHDSGRDADLDRRVPDQSLEEARHKMHSLLDDAFALVAPRYYGKNKISPGDLHPAQAPPKPYNKSCKHGGRQSRKVHAYPLSSEAQSSDVASQSDSQDKGEPERDKKHTPMYINPKSNQINGSGSVLWSPYSAADESAKILASPQQGNSRPSSGKRVPRTSPQLFKSNGFQNENPAYSDTTESIPLGSRSMPKSDLSGPSRQRTGNSRKATQPDDYTSIVMSSSMLTPSGQQRTHSPPERDFNSHPYNLKPESSISFTNGFNDTQSDNLSTNFSKSSFSKTNGITKPDIETGGSWAFPVHSTSLSTASSQNLHQYPPKNPATDEIDVAQRVMKKESVSKPLVDSIKEELKKMQNHNS